MQAFVLRENLKRYSAILQESTDAEIRARVTGMVAVARRELALLEAGETGALRPWRRSPGRMAALAEAAVAEFGRAYAGSEEIAALIDPSPGLHYLDVNPAYEAAAGQSREALTGRALFDLYPADPSDPSFDGVTVLYDGLRRAAERGQTVELPRYRYDVTNLAGERLERYWRNVARPLRLENGAVFLVMIVRDATDEAA